MLVYNMIILGLLVICAILTAMLKEEVDINEKLKEQLDKNKKELERLYWNMEEKD